jgi:pyruvate,water dikinase
LAKQALSRTGAVENGDRAALRNIAWFSEVRKKDVGSVGGKGANLGELTSARIPVPPGFIVTAEAYFRFLDSTRIRPLIRRELHGLDVQNSPDLQEAADKIQQIILEAPMPLSLEQEIRAAYQSMGEGFVAVRSSATAEDLPEASFAGQQSTFLNVHGGEKVVEAVKGCWASLFNARAIFYRADQKYDHFKVGIAVPVQRMVQSQASGVMFTLEPVTSDKSKIVIEAVLGLGEAIVSGEVTPDLFILDKDSLRILSKKVHSQEWQLVKNPEEVEGDRNVKIPIAKNLQSQQKISDEEVVELARLGKSIESHYQFPQDIEWAKETGNLFVTQARPVTTIKEKVAELNAEIGGAAVLLAGSPASPGMACGPVKILMDATQISKILKGDVLVAPMTTPDFVPAMKKACSIVTDQGGRTSHAAIVSRELGIPCIVGAPGATTTLKEGESVTVDGSNGRVYHGNVMPKKMAKSNSPSINRKRIKTRTKVYVNLAQPDLAASVAKRHVDGVGLLRAEFIMSQIGEHPRHMLKEHRGEEYIEKLFEGVNAIARAFNPRPVVYRTSDFKTNEYRNLKGGADYESVEENPMLGYRGCSRYVEEPDVFSLEMEAIKRVRQENNNLHVMIPFVRTVAGLADVKEMMEDYGLVRSDYFKLWMMVEVPSNIFLIDKFIDVGIDGISIGSNDLTQLILGTDRDSEKLAHIFDERNEAVQMALEKAVTTARAKGITASICGQAPSVYPEVTEKLVQWGITSVSVSPDMIDVTREIIARIEEKVPIEV